MLRIVHPSSAHQGPRRQLVSFSIRTLPPPLSSVLAAPPSTEDRRGLVLDCSGEFLEIHQGPVHALKHSAELLEILGHAEVQSVEEQSRARKRLVQLTHCVLQPLGTQRRASRIDRLFQG